MWLAASIMIATGAAYLMLVAISIFPFTMLGIFIVEAISAPIYTAFLIWHKLYVRRLARGY